MITNILIMFTATVDVSNCLRSIRKVFSVLLAAHMLDMNSFVSFFEVFPMFQNTAYSMTNMLILVINHLYIF